MRFSSRTACRAAVLALAAAIGGCAFDAGGGVTTASLGGQVPVTQAFMVPPPGGPSLIAVLEQRFRNALAQDIILQNNSGLAGQNVLYVRAFGPMGRDAGDATLPPDIPSLSRIQSELRQRFPGVHMEISGLYAQNRYGPIGYATGRSRSGVNCIYVWQRIAPEPALFRVERGSITWRLRLCDPHMTPRELLLTAYGFTVTGSFKSPNWNPFGPPPKPDPRIGEPGEVILPEQPVDPTVIAPVAFGTPRKTRLAAPRRAPSRPQRVARATQQPVPPRPAVLNLPAPGAAVVPRPENTDLTEPAIQGSNLPGAAPRAQGRLSVPLPPTTRPGEPVVRPVPGAILAPPPSGPSVILPREQSNLLRPEVRVVDVN